MKKFYFKKSTLLASVITAGLLVSCALKIINVTVPEKVQQGETFKMTVNFAKDQLTGGEYWLYCGVRVQEDWNVTDVVFNNDGENGTSEESIYSFTDSPNYKKLLDYTLPCSSGYKWVAFQSEAVHGVNGDNPVAYVTMTAGQSMGKFAINFVGGGSTIAPEEIILADGSVNVNRVFGNKTGVANTPNDNNTQAGIFEPSEYILDFGTISQEEIDKSTERLTAAGVKATVGDYTLPIKMAVDEKYTKPISVEVVENTNAGIDEVAGDVADVNINAVDGGIEVEAEGAVATVYDMTGIVLDSKAVNGVARLNARYGMCIVRVVSGNNTTVAKIAVK